MLLQRMKTLSEPNCQKEELDWDCSNNEASVRVNKFGNGPDQYSDFRVILTWHDIEEIVKGMAAKNHEGALRAQRALCLADAIEGLVKNSN
jgi:hypothetical protein